MDKGWGERPARRRFTGRSKIRARVGGGLFMVLCDVVVVEVVVCVLGGGAGCECRMFMENRASV